jgi:hypothetical protein
MDNKTKANDQPSNLGIYICAIILTLECWVLLDMALAGLKPISVNLGGGILINGIIGWYIWKRNNWRPIIGALLVATAYVALHLAANFLAIKPSQ